MMTAYTLLNEPVQQIVPPVDGTLSRTVHQDDRLKAVLFGFLEAKSFRSIPRRHRPSCIF